MHYTCMRANLCIHRVGDTICKHQSKISGLDTLTHKNLNTSNEHIEGTFDNNHELLLRTNTTIPNRGNVVTIIYYV